MMVGAHQREIARVQVTRLVARDIDDLEGSAVAPRRRLDGTHVDARVKAKQREVAAEAIEDRDAVVEPRMRRARAGYGAWGVAVPVVRGRGRAVRNDDRRARVENAEVDPRNVELGR